MPAPPLSFLVAYFEQWLNGLVYELFFPAELHARRLTLFAETARINPPDIAAVPEQQKLARLQELHAAAEKSALPTMLTDLAKVEEFRIIEVGWRFRQENRRRQAGMNRAERNEAGHHELLLLEIRY